MRCAPFIACSLLAWTTAYAGELSGGSSGGGVDRLIPWLLEEGHELKGIPFGDVLAATSGRKILPVDPSDPGQAPVLARIGEALDRTLVALNDPGHPAQHVGRINEASSHVEDQLREELNKVPGWKCTIPPTAEGREQRSGYPDIRLEVAPGDIYYLDPKLFAPDNRNSSLRTFYFEPRSGTNKVTEDARHLLVGICHVEGEGGKVRFLSWELVDVSRLRVRLKAEFQASNHDLYRDDQIVARGGTP